jgi:hypothetical protein
MATEDERRALGRTRRLVFQNLANGVPPERVRQDLQISALELDQARRFVAKKIADFLFLRRLPPVPADDLGAIRHNRRALLGALAQIGDLNLSTDVIVIPATATKPETRFTLKLTTQALDHPEMVEGMRHRMRNSHS